MSERDPKLAQFLADVANEFNIEDVSRRMVQLGILNPKTFQNWMQKTAKYIYYEMPEYRKQADALHLSYARFYKMVRATLDTYLKRRRKERGKSLLLPPKYLGRNVVVLEH